MADLMAVIRGTMGGREYFIGKMTFQELSSKVQFYEDLESSPGIDQLLQRRLSKRSEDMVQYLLRQRERFYGAIIVAAWGGRPEYVQVKMEDHPLLDDNFEFGLLKFDGKQEYFALDGQHRLKSIKEAIERDRALRHEEVSVIFVTHERTEEGNIRTRRLFHTLNRYARPTTTGQNIALDEDNAVSIATRMLLKSDIQCLRPEHLELVTKSVRKNQQDKFSSLAALWDFNMAVVGRMYGLTKDSAYLKYRPDADDIDQIYETLFMLWNEVRDTFTDFARFESGKVSAGDLREPGGVPASGNVLFRPLGLRVVGIVISRILPEYSEFPVAIGKEMDPEFWTKVMERISLLPLCVGEPPWRGTIFRDERMFTDARSRDMSVRLGCYMLDVGDEEETKLIDDYRGHLDNIDATLPEKVVG